MWCCWFVKLCCCGEYWCVKGWFCLDDFYRHLIVIVEYLIHDAMIDYFETLLILYNCWQRAQLLSSVCSSSMFPPIVILLFTHFYKKIITLMRKLASVSTPAVSHWVQNHFSLSHHWSLWHPVLTDSLMFFLNNCFYYYSLLFFSSFPYLDVFSLLTLWKDSHPLLNLKSSHTCSRPTHVAWLHLFSGLFVCTDCSWLTAPSLSC